MARHSEVTVMSAFDAMQDLYPTFEQDPRLHDVTVLTLGGTTMGALRDPDTKFEFGSDGRVSCVTLNPNAVLPNWRLSKNGTPLTMRDWDGLVVTTDPTAVYRVDQIARGATMGQLEVSTFGIKPHHEWLEAMHGPNKLRRAVAHAKSFLSERTLDEHGVHRYVLWPFAQVISGEAYDGVPYVLPNGSVTVGPSPEVALSFYFARSISGLRPKDRTKIDETVAQVMKHEELRTRIFEGPASDVFAFAAMTHALRLLPRDRSKRSIDLGNTKIPYEKLWALEGTDTAKVGAALKANALHAFETQQWIVDLFLHPRIQSLFGGIIGTR